MRRMTRTLTPVIAGVVVAALGLVVGPAPFGGTATLTSPPTVSASQWTNAHAPSASGSNLLNDVSCTTASFCVAVGQQNSGAGGGSLVEQWNGSSWAVVPSVNVPATSDDNLVSVSCVGPSFCMAVGSSGLGAVAETWNGTAWTLATPVIPSNVTGGAALWSVSCVSTTVCETLGTGFNVSTPEVFGNQWNGTAWSLVPAATPSASGTPPLIEATGMDCVTTTSCIAVGTTNVGSATATPFSEQWNGSSWSLVTVAMPTGGGVTGSFLASVSCAGASFCESAGQVNGTHNQNLIENWNGSTWAIVPNVPDTSPTQNQGLTAVDCFSQTTCSAVGTATAASGPSPATLALSWNGTSWSIVSGTPNQGTLRTTLAGESCVTNWACVAVGDSNTAPATLTGFAMSAPIARSGYRFVASDGGVFSYGSGAPFLGSTGSIALNKPIVGMSVMPGGDGYDIVASDGGIFNYGSAQFYGSTGSLHLNAPVVGMALTADGAGYWLVATDGGIFSYGDAQFYGSTGSLKLNKPIVGMAATPDGKGYWLVASDGGIFSYGDAAFAGSTGSLVLNKPVVGMAAPVGGGYYLVATDGGIFSFPTSGGPPFLGSTGSIVLNKPIVGMTTVAGGYYLSGSDGGVFTYPTTGGPPFLGSTGSIVLNKPIVGIAG
jgi:hypothetical protein